VIISFVFSVDGLPFTSLVIMVLWDWSLSCWQQELKSMLKIRFGQLRFVLTCLLQDGFTPLHHACSGGHVEVVTVLLSAGAPIEAQNHVRREGMRVVIISFVFRMERLPFTSLVIMVLWDWSLSCWQQELKSMLKIR
jgi:hypothetical protein